MSDSFDDSDMEGGSHLNTSGLVGNPASGYRLQQMRDNYRFAMSKASRFLDTSLKVSELEHRQKIYDNEIDELILQDESDAEQQEEIYDSIKPKGEDMDSTGNGENQESGLDSEVDHSATTRRKKRKTRGQQQKEEQRIKRLLQMHTQDFKFYRPRSGQVLSQATNLHVNTTLNESVENA